jgi:hypothetical protein
MEIFERTQQSKPLGVPIIISSHCHQSFTMVVEADLVDVPFILFYDDYDLSDLLCWVKCVTINFRKPISCLTRLTIIKFYDHWQ